MHINGRSWSVLRPNFSPNADRRFSDERRSRLARGIYFAAIWILLTAPVTAQDDVECGLRCLYVASVSLGNQGGYAAVKSAAPGPISDKGYSLKQLRDLAQEMGFETMLVQTTYERLAARSKQQPFACIGWLASEHFVVLGDLRDGEIFVIDPPDQRWSDSIVFKRRWAGHALLLSTQPLLPEDDLRQIGWFHWVWLSLVTFAAVGSFLYFTSRRTRPCDGSSC